LTVAIDGPAGVGKSTIAKLISQKAGLFYLNTGNFYRAVTLDVIKKKLDIKDTDRITEISKVSDIKIINSHIYLNGTDIEDQLHTDAVDSLVAQVSTIKELRMDINRKIRSVSKNLDVIAEGRDMTTVVFPDAEVKVFLDASIETRASRRSDQGVSEKNISEIQDSIKKRDEIDRNKEYGNLKISEDAIYLNTSDLTIDQVCDKVMSEINKNRHIKY
jgi:cytidylate kinase